MAIQEQSVYYKAIQAEQDAFWKRRRARRIDHDLVPRDVLDRLEPTWRHWETIPESEARHLESSEEVKLFLLGKHGWEAVPNLRRREIGQPVLAFRRLKPHHRLGGGRPKARPKTVPHAWMFQVGGDTPPEAVATITRPQAERVELSDTRYTRTHRLLHRVKDGDTRERIARQYTGKADPALVENAPPGELVPGRTVQVRAGRELMAAGSAWHTDSVQFEWIGPTTGRVTVPVVSEGWEHAFPARPGTYTLTVSAGESRHSRTVRVVPPRSEGVAVRVGVFFDGTGNNRENDVPEGTDTNIARLYELHKGKPEENAAMEPIGIFDELPLYSFKIYREGIGSRTGEENDALDMATGAGGVSRIEAVLKRVEAFVTQFSDRDGPRIVDVFGFSRGAALARDFVNQVNARLSAQGVQVGFVGLYDTVGSFGLPGNDVDIRSDAPLLAGVAAEVATNPVLYGPTLPRAAMTLSNTYRLDLGLASAVKVVHLVAINEYRANFPLQSLRTGPNAPPPGNVEEIAVPGAHADVGGGYGPRSWEEYTHVDDDVLQYQRVGPTSQWQARLLKQKAALEARAAQRGLEAVFVRSTSNAVGEVVEEYALVRRRRVKPGLSNVYLHAMYKKAEAAGVPLTDLDDMAKKQPIRFAIPEEIRRHFQPDWVTPRTAWYLEAHYVHTSAVDWSNRKSLVDWLANRPDDERRVYYNEPDKAVVPAHLQPQPERSLA